MSEDYCQAMPDNGNRRLIASETIADHHFQRLYRSDASARVRQEGGQAVDATDPAGQGANQKGTQRLQKSRDGGPRGFPAFNQVSPSLQYS